MKWLVVVGLLSIAFSGCLEGNYGDETGSSGAPVDGAGPVGQPASGTPASHGQPQAEMGPVESFPPQTNQVYWEVRQEITIDNDFGGAAQSDISLRTAVGGITVEPSPDGDYHYLLKLVGGGGTQEEAQAAFDSIEWNHDDALASGTLSLDTWIHSDISGGISCSMVGPLAQCSGQYWRGFITAQIPAAPSHAISIDTATADYSVVDLSGSVLGIDTSTGDGELNRLTFGVVDISTSTGDLDIGRLDCARFEFSSSTGDVAADRIVAKTLDIDTDTGDFDVGAVIADEWTHVSDTGDLVVENAAVLGWNILTQTGDFDLTGAVRDFSFQSSTGDLMADIVPTATGAYQIDTSTGDIELEFNAPADAGFDVQATSNTGDISIDIPNSETLADEDERVHKRTQGYSSAPLRIAVSLDSSTGDLTVQA